MNFHNRENSVQKNKKGKCSSMSIIYLSNAHSFLYQINLYLMFLMKMNQQVPHTVQIYAYTCILYVYTNVLQNLLWNNWIDANCAALYLFHTSVAAVIWPSAVFSRQSFPVEQLIPADQRSHFCCTKPLSIYVSVPWRICVVKAIRVFALKRDVWSQQRWSLL